MSREGKVAFLFPGQGSQETGMGKDVVEHHAVARRVFETADAALGFPLSTLCFEGPDDELKLTENTQPAILTTSTALGETLRAGGARPDIVAGHSLGEYSALVAARGLGISDAVRLVRNRGRYMQEAVPVGVGAMAAILGLALEGVTELCAASRDEGEVLAPANMNGAGQIVIAGHKTAVERACAGAKVAGARRALPLPVSAPFHCSLMKSAADRLAPELADVKLGELEVPLLTNVDARPITRADDARDALLRQIDSPVRWEETIEAMAEMGVTRFVEVGPGKVLSGLARKIVKGAEVFTVGTSAGAAAYLMEAQLA